MVKGKKYLLCAGILWMLLCPEAYTQDNFSCLERTDGQEISGEEVEKVWQAILYGEEGTEVHYKSKLAEWLKEQPAFRAIEN